jgi:hypothetical protein
MGVFSRKYLPQHKMIETIYIYKRKIYELVQMFGPRFIEDVVIRKVIYYNKPSVNNGCYWLFNE